jgi:hypothetical protein
MKLGTLKGFVLAKEVSEIGQFNISNISMILKGLVENQDYIKIENRVFLNKDIRTYPYIMDALNKATDLTPFIPKSYVSSFLGIDLSPFKGSFEIIEISGVEFFKFKDPLFIKAFTKDTYILSKEELKEAIDESYIDGYIPVGKKYLVWY